MFSGLLKNLFFGISKTVILLPVLATPALADVSWSEPDDNMVVARWSKEELKPLPQTHAQRMDEIKKQLLGKATQHARDRAGEIISSTDLKIDKLISARSGVFQITEPYSTEVSGYGIHNTSSSTKNIKVTVSAEFSLK